MKKYLVSASLGALAVLSLMLGANMAAAATTPVENWIALLPPGTGATIAGATTNSPVVTSDNVTIGANFTPTTLVNNGDFIELTASVTFSDTARGDSFRWGLFDGDDPVVPILAGNTWDGYFAFGPGPNSDVGKLYSKTGGVGGAKSPLSTSAENGAIELANLARYEPLGDLPAVAQYNFGIRVRKTVLGGDVTAFLNDNDDVNGVVDMTGFSPVSGETLTTLSVDSVAILMTGNLNASSEDITTFSGINVTTGNIPTNADFDSDGDVDGTDFLTWQRGFSAAGGLAEGDADGSGFVNATDLELWESQFGIAPLVGAVAAIPEPISVALVGIAFAILATRRPRLVS